MSGTNENEIIIKANVLSRIRYACDEGNGSDQEARECRGIIITGKTEENAKQDGIEKVLGRAQWWGSSKLHVEHFLDTNTHTLENTKRNMSNRKSDWSRMLLWVDEVTSWSGPEKLLIRTGKKRDDTKRNSSSFEGCAGGFLNSVQGEVHQDSWSRKKFSKPMDGKFKLQNHVGSESFSVSENCFLLTLGDVTISKRENFPKKFYWEINLAFPFLNNDVKANMSERVY